MYVRFSVTCVHRDGYRKLAVPALQARYLWDVQEEAESWLRQCLEQPDNQDRLRQIYGEQALSTFRVDPIKCYDHGDPMGWPHEEELSTSKQDGDGDECDSPLLHTQEPGEAAKRAPKLSPQIMMGIRRLLEQNRRECECKHGADEHEANYKKCVACQIAAVIQA